MKTIYKRHLSGPMAITALCGSHTSAKKFALNEWLEFTPRERCPKCEAMQNMGAPRDTRPSAAPPI